MITETITCDGCGKVKKETNHWSSVETLAGDRIQLIPRIVTEGLVRHYCSDSCIITVVQQWLSAQQESFAKDREPG